MPDGQPKLIVQSERLEDAPALIECGADVFLWAPQNYTLKVLEKEVLEAGSVKPVLVLPAVMRSQELDEVHGFVCGHKERLLGVVINNPGQFALKWPVPIFGGQGLNIMNRECAAFFHALGAKRLTASCELSLKELKELMAFGGNYEIEAYGRTQLMLLSHCPRRTNAGHEVQDAACQACASSGGVPAVYTDRKGYRFEARRLRMPHGCIVRLYNSVKTDMARSAQKLHELGCSLRLSFLGESLDMQKEIVSSYRSILDQGVSLHRMDENTTSGHLMRGVG